MKISKEEYSRMTKAQSPKSGLFRDCLWAFCVGGGICCLGQLIYSGWCAAGYILSDAASLTGVTLIIFSAVLTATGLYQKIAAKAGAGTLVPITGFANAVVSPAVEFKAEGYITGVGAKMFIIAGPVIVYGISASAVWGVIYYFLRPYI